MSKTLSEDMILSGVVPSELEILQQAAGQIAQHAAKGFQPAVDPDIADFMGAFQETALSSLDAEQSIYSVDLDTGVVISIDGEAA